MRRHGRARGVLVRARRACARAAHRWGEIRHGGARVGLHSGGGKDRLDLGEQPLVVDALRVRRVRVAPRELRQLGVVQLQARLVNRRAKLGLGDLARAQRVKVLEELAQPDAAAEDVGLQPLQEHTNLNLGRRGERAKHLAAPGEAQIAGECHGTCAVRITNGADRQRRGSRDAVGPRDARRGERLLTERHSAKRKAVTMGVGEEAPGF